ncbi:MAG: hypothetical protein ACYTAF_08010 [Planctomycetota bacterium]
MIRPLVLDGWARSIKCKTCGETMEPAIGKYPRRFLWSRGEVECVPCARKAEQEWNREQNLKLARAALAEATTTWWIARDGEGELRAWTEEPEWDEKLDCFPADDAMPLEDVGFDPADFEEIESGEIAEVEAG